MRLTKMWNLAFAGSLLALLACAPLTAQPSPAGSVPTIDPNNWPQITSAVKIDPEIEQKVSEWIELTTS